MEFNSFKISFEKMNINVDKSTTKKVNSDYKYYRSILNLSPDSTSQSIQRRLYINVQCSFDNNSPNLLPICVLIYGIKNEAKNDTDFSIYDYENAYEITNNEFLLHIPVVMNNKDLNGLQTPPASNSSAISLDYLKSYILIHLDETLLQKFMSRYCLILFKIDRGISSEVTSDSSRRISELINQTLPKEFYFEQKNIAKQPTLLSELTSEIKFRQYLDFNGSQYMISNNFHFNPIAVGYDDFFVFIVYKLISFSGSYWTRNGFFGHDNGVFEKFVSFGPSGDLIVSGTTNRHIVIGTNNVNNVAPIAAYQTKANAGELNKWCCLSIH